MEKGRVKRGALVKFSEGGVRHEGKFLGFGVSAVMDQAEFLRNVEIDSWGWRPETSALVLVKKEIRSIPVGDIEVIDPKDFVEDSGNCGSALMPNIQIKYGGDFVWMVFVLVVVALFVAFSWLYK